MTFHPAILRIARPLAAMVAVLVVAAVAWAQTTADDAPAAETTVEPGALERIERGLGNETLADAELARNRIEVELLLDELAARRTEAAEAVDTIAAQVEALGEPSETESAEVTSERRRLTEERAALAVTLNRIDDEVARAETLSRDIAERRRVLFTETLFHRHDLGEAFASDPGRQFARTTREFVELVAGWLGRITSERAGATLIAGVVILVGAVLAIAATARLRPFLAPSDAPKRRPSYLSRVSRAFGLIVLRTLGFLLFGVFTVAVLEYFGLLDDPVVESMAVVLVLALVGLQFAWSVLRVALAPGRPSWRLFDLDDRAATTLFRLASLVVLVFVLDGFFGFFLTRTGAPVTLLVIQNLVAVVLTGGLLIAIASMRHARLALVHASEVQDGEAALTAAPSAERRRWSPAIRLPLLAIGVALIVSALLGYIGLAQFAARQIVVTGAIVATMFIGLQVARALSSGEALARTPVGRMVGPETDEASLDRLGVALRLAVSIAVLVVGLPLILIQWGFSWGELGASAAAMLRGVRIGSITLSLGGILLGVLVFALGWFLTRVFQRWLDRAVLERGRVDLGVRNSIRTIVGYVGLVIVVLFALSVAGVNFASLAVVAGALSVGIGFGLQNIVSNFVSGLILLAERPFRVGDIVETGTTVGVIQRISVRSTTIETFTKQSVIVPNSDLINGVVSNWTLGDRQTRADIPVGVSYDADPRRVHEMLLEIARAHPLTLDDPEPMVVFNGFGESSLDFELRFYLANVSDKIPTSNEVSYQILERMKAEGIEIPFPQRDLHIRTGSLPPAANSDEPEEVDAVGAKGAASAPEMGRPALAARKG